MDQSASCSLTDGLHSLQLGSNGEDYELASLLPLKRKFRYHTCGSCAAAAFFVASLNAALKRAEIVSKTSSSQVQVTVRKSSKFTTKSTPSTPRTGKQCDRRLRVGLIGCGRLARQLLAALVAFSSVQPSDVIISTPRVEDLGDLQALGMACVFDNALVASEADVIFLCCLPFALKEIARDIVGRVNPKAVLYSLVSATPQLRLQNILKHDLIVTLPHGEKAEYGSPDDDGASVASRLLTPADQLYAPAYTRSATAVTSQHLLAVDWEPRASGGLTASSAALLGGQALRGDSEEGMLTQSVACLSAAGQRAGDEMSVAPQHILSLLRSSQLCRDIFPLARVLDDDPVGESTVCAGDGIRWAAELAVSLWNSIQTLHSCSRADAVAIINSVLFDEKITARTSTYGFRNKMASPALLRTSDFESRNSATTTSQRNSCPEEALDTGFVPFSLCNVDADFPSLFRRFQENHDLARAMQKKYLTFFGISPALHGKSASQIHASRSTRQQIDVHAGVKQP